MDTTPIGSSVVRQGQRQKDYGFGIRVQKPGERWADTRRIDVREPGELDFWTKLFGVDLMALMVAVDKVGTEASRVRQYLERRGPVH